MTRGVRLHGTAASRTRDGDDYISYDIEFPPDQLFRGVQDNVGIDRSGRSPTVRQQDEIYVLHMFHRAALPVHHTDLCYFIAPKTLHTGTAIFYNAQATAQPVSDEQSRRDGHPFSTWTQPMQPDTLAIAPADAESPKLPVPLQDAA